VLAYVSPHAPHILRDLNLQGIPAFATPETCALVLRVAMDRSSRVKPAPAPASTGGTNLPHPLPRGTLTEAQAGTLFAQAGIPVAPFRIVQTGTQAATAAQQLGGEVVLKLLSRQVAHKSDIGGVKLGLTAATIPAALAEMTEKVAAHGVTPDAFLVQKMMRGGVELILGLRHDPQLGTFLLLGAGGVLAELSSDTSVRLLPVTASDARDMVGELRISHLLAGYRGSKPYDLAALVDTMVAFARMAEALSDHLIEAEINPLLVFPETQGVAAADGLAVLQD
jgi:acetate---CoA ligase (ADP-forming)